MVFISKNLHLTKIPSRSEADIVVAKKKLDSIREWISNSEQPGASRIMLITGPSGSGKSAAVRLVAAETNLELHEWCAPVPTLWEDFRYIDLPSASYTSKVDEFLAFIARAFRYSPLDLGLETRVGEHKDKGEQVSKITRKKFLLVDDLPFVNNLQQSERVRTVLRQLMRQTMFPVIFVMTDAGRRKRTGVRSENGYLGSGETKYWCASPLSIDHCLSHELNLAGAVTVSLNPVTVPRLVNALSVIAMNENLKVPHATLVDLAASAAGDIRSAITSLQFLASQDSEDNAHHDKQEHASKHADSSSAMNDTKDMSCLPAPGWSKLVQRHDVLSTFHALGKILHNKRMSGVCDNLRPHSFKIGKYFSKPFLETDTWGPELSGTTAQRKHLVTIMPVHPSLRREPTLYDPEMILSSSRLSAVSTIDFLFENYADFIPDAGIGDAVLALGYISDASLLQFWSSAACVKMDVPPLSGNDRNFFAESDRISEHAAGSIVTRGLLFAPDPSRPEICKWFQIRAPQAGKVFRAASKNLFEVQKFVVTASKSVLTFWSHLATAAAETLPILRVIASTDPSGDSTAPHLPKYWENVEGEISPTKNFADSQIRVSRAFPSEFGSSLSEGNNVTQNSLNAFPGRTAQLAPSTCEVDNIAEW
ncbi:predicted protein [Micromonas commoda]|uniref:AAA+ ATPase domain-containing protein n=1 Tax=Micromonas commoda (strain RCC299 / NOUM17 / CCMP2709) TaxID=296587 RepID=C1FDR6_MICCC|nr:predicted protein [Micromonas commoda]ACO68831.1 predicted protein [Micromonas commoda]|eukprot:XP_002507573.1 predicted protein [Micromonas commoda]